MRAKQFCVLTTKNLVVKIWRLWNAFKSPIAWAGVRSKTKRASEYNQEIPQSQTADKPEASWGRATQQTQDTRKTNKAKQPALSLPYRDDCKTRMDTKLRTTKYRTTTESQNGNNNRQRMNNNRTTTLERTAVKATRGGGGLNAFLLVPNLRPRFCCCWSTKTLSSHGGFLTIAVHHLRETK